jgi:hypothetical protein
MRWRSHHVSNGVWARGVANLRPSNEVEGTASKAGAAPMERPAPVAVTRRDTCQADAGDQELERMAATPFSNRLGRCKLA